MRLGERLRRERQRRHLSQEALAEALGISVRSIGRWEHDQAVPQGYVRLHLSRFFGISPEELFGELEDEMPLALAWTVPLPRNPYFTGRETILDALHTRLATTQPIALTQASALSGLGGIGKTQVAIEYAYRFAQEYRAIFWLVAETSETLMASLQRIAEQLQLSERQATEQSRMVAAVQRWLMANTGWLLIADNVEEADLLQTVLPPARQGTILLTTRRQSLGILAETLELPPMNGEEGVTLILRRARWFNTLLSDGSLPQERVQDMPAEARDLVTYLEGLPLALDQAGAYIEETGCSLEDYLQRCRDQRKQILARRGTHGGAHPASVTTTLKLSIEQVERQHPAAVDLLRVCAFLHPEAIPEELFQAGSPHLGPVLGQITADPYQFDLALAALRSASLVTRHAKTRTLSVHRLVQAVIQDQMETSEKQLWGQRVVRLINAAFPVWKFAEWEACERYLVQAMACMPLLTQTGSDLAEAGELLSKLGGYLVERGRFDEADPLLEQAMVLEKQHYGNNHLALTPTLEKRAELLWQRGQHVRARTLLLRVLAIKEFHLGPSHPQVAETLNNLAIIHGQQGQFEDAVSLCQRALDICEQHAGDDPTELGRALNNLATIYRRQGKYHLAEPLFQRVLAIYEQQLGPTHPDTALPLNNLATLYRTQGKDEQAEALYQRALAIYEQHLGPEHSDTALMRNNLAIVYQRQGKAEQAERLFQHALQTRERQLGDLHPETAITLNGLANLYRDQEKYEQAEPLYQRALRIREQQPGPEHLNTATTLADLAALYYKQGKLQAARSLYQRALAINEKRLVSDHPTLLHLREQYASLLQALGSEDEAK